MSPSKQNNEDASNDAAPVHSVRMRRSPSKRPSRGRKSQHKPASPNGIHRRANKRMGW